MSRISISDTGIRIIELDVPRREVADYLRTVPDDDRENELVRALEVGVFCLERARVGQDLDFVKHQIDALLTRVTSAAEKIPAATEKALLEKLGTKDGQALAPVRVLVEEVTKAAGDRIREVRELLAQDIDPRNETSTLGQALRRLRELLDPQRTDSIQGAVTTALEGIAAENGKLAEAVKKVVAEAVKPLADRVGELEKEIRGREAAAEAVEQTTLKGAKYEDEVVTLLQDWGGQHGVKVHHVGVDNRPGDIVVEAVVDPAAQQNLRIVIEARDRQTAAGRQSISADLKAAMIQRDARAAIYVSRHQAGLGREVGEWAEGACGSGPYVACVHEHLITAIRFLLVQDRLAFLRAAAPVVDAASIEQQLGRVRTSLGRIRTVKTKLTEIRKTADAIEGEADSLRGEVNGALDQIDDALRRARHANDSAPQGQAG